MKPIHLAAGGHTLCGLPREPGRRVSEDMRLVNCPACIGKVMKVAADKARKDPEVRTLKKMRPADVARLRPQPKPDPPMRHPMHSCLSCGYEIMPLQPEQLVTGREGNRYMHAEMSDCIAGVRSRSYYGGRRPHIDAGDNWPADPVEDQPRRAAG